MRPLQLAALLFAVSSSAGTLTVLDADMTLTFPDPSQSGPVKASGEVWVSCGPCSEPLNTQKYAFREISFVYQNAPAVIPYRVGGLYTPDRMSRWSFDATNLLPRGARLYPILKAAMCICGNGAEVAWVDVPKPELAVTTDPRMGTLVVITGDGAVVGKTDKLVATCTANPQQGEQAVIEIQGPGIALRQAFTSGPDLRFEPQITPTAPGTIEAWCTLLPYGNKSNVLTRPVVAAEAPRSSSTKSSKTEDPEPMGEAGCSVAGAPAFALLAGLALRRRRRQA